jgi:hypothetical protein
MRASFNLFVWFLIAILFASCTSAPEEADIRRQFESKRAAFERVLEMSNEDYATSRVTRIAPDFTRLEDDWSWPRNESRWGISKPRWDEYRAAFAEAGIDGIDRSDADNRAAVFFHVWGEGMLDSTHSRGVVYSPSPMTDFRGESQKVLYRPLDANWYYYDWVTW